MISGSQIRSSEAAPDGFTSIQIGPALVTLIPGSRRQVRVEAPYNPRLVALARRRFWSWDRQHKRWIGLYSDIPRLRQLYGAEGEKAA